MSILETESIPDGDGLKKNVLNDEETKSSNKENSTIFDPHKEEMSDYLAEPKRNNMRRISDEIKITATGALESSKGGIKKAASGLSSGIKSVTNKISLPKSPTGFRRRSWHDYDELEEHICDNDSFSDEGDAQNSKKKGKKDKSKKVEDSKEKSPKSKKGGKNKSGKKNDKKKTDWCSVSGDELETKRDVKEIENEIPQSVQNCKDEPTGLFDSLDTADLLSKVTITVQETN